MAKALVLSAALLLAAAVLLLAGGAEAGAGVEVPLSWELGVEDVADDGFGFPGAGGSDAVARRVLQNNGYISYGALRRDNVPCSVRGTSYYNCRPGGQANPYNRGCSAITRCRG